MTRRVQKLSRRAARGEISRAASQHTLVEKPRRPVTSLWQPQSGSPGVAGALTKPVAAPTYYDLIVIWDPERRNRPWAAGPTRVQIRGRNFDSIVGYNVRLVISYWAPYTGEHRGELPMTIETRTDRSLTFVTDDEGLESALTAGREFFGIIDQSGKSFMAKGPREIRKVSPSGG